MLLSDHRSARLTAAALLGVGLLAGWSPGCTYDFDSPFSQLGAESALPDAAPPDSEAADAGAEGAADQAAPDVSQDALDDAVADGSEDLSGGDAADAAIVSPLARVQSGTASLPSGQASLTVPISPVDPSRAFLLFGLAYAGGQPRYDAVTGRIATDSTLAFNATNASPSPVQVSWYVAEFESGVQVQRGSQQFLSQASRTVHLPLPVDLTRSFPLISYRTNGQTFGSNDFFTARLATSSTLELAATATSTSTVEWQVVTFDGCAVVHGDATLPDGATSVTASIPPVDASRTWLLFTHTVDASFATPEPPTRNITLRGSLSAPDSLLFQRYGDVGQSTITWHAITFDNGTEVRRGTTNLLASSATALAPVPGLDTARCVAAAGGLYHHGGASALTTADTGEASVTLALTGSGLSLTRGAAQSTSAVDWFAVQFR